MTAVAINGVTGRMGRVLVSLIHDNPRLHLRGAFTHENSSYLGRDVGELVGATKIGVPVAAVSPDVLQTADVIIDFSVPEATVSLLDYCTDQHLGLVSGTTGFSLDQQNMIAQAARRVPVLTAPNMSIGVNVAFQLLEHTTRMLDPSIDIEIFECHHRNKLDAPSGTAQRMAEVISSVRARQHSLEDKGTDSTTDGHQLVEIHSARGGDVVGEHTVTFFGTGERLEITHRASSRSNFAAGAVQAAMFIAEKLEHGEVGMYGMNEVLGLH